MHLHVHVHAVSHVRNDSKKHVSTPSHSNHCMHYFFTSRILLCMHCVSKVVETRIACRYVPGAAYMNVNSQVQIRQLLFPTYCEKPAKSFKASNPDYDPDARPRKPRWIDFEIHGLWGNGQPGRLAVDTTTAKGLPAASSAVLWSLVGKPGAARNALKALDEKEAAQRGDDAAAAGSSSSGSHQEAALVSIHEDADDADLHDIDDDEISSSAAAGGSAAAAAAPEVQLVPGGDLSDEQLAALQAEAASMKLGKMYAAMGGGRAGIEACLALEQLIEVRIEDKKLVTVLKERCFASMVASARSKVLPVVLGVSPMQRWVAAGQALSRALLWSSLLR
jgi:hypothetical protein